MLQSGTVLITGASAGIGEACARAFAAEGARLVLAARRTDRLEALGAELAEAHGTKWHAIALDVRDREAVNAAIAGLPADFADIDVLVNNAGLSRGLDKLQEGYHLDWEEMIDTNVKGLLWVSRAVMPPVSEIAAKRSPCTSMFTLKLMPGRSWSSELSTRARATNVRLPGFTRLPISTISPVTSANDVLQVSRRTWSPRSGMPDAATRLARQWLTCSPKSRSSPASSRGVASSTSRTPGSSTTTWKASDTRGSRSRSGAIRRES